MRTRVSKVSAAALLAIVLSLNVVPSAYAARRDDSGTSVGDTIVRFIRDIRHFFMAHTSTDNLSQPKP